MRRRRGPTPGPIRRSKRRIAGAIVATLVLALVLGETINDVVKSSNGARMRALASWEAVASPLIVEENALTTTLESFRLQGAVRTRAEDDASLALLGNLTDRERHALDSIVLGPPNARAGALLTSIVSDRAAAIDSIEAGYGRATAPPHDIASASASFAAAGRSLIRADVAYRSLLSDLKVVGGRGLFPPSSWWDTDGAEWSAQGAARFAAALAFAHDLTALSSIDLVAVSVLPRPLHISGLPATPTTTTTTSTTTSTTTTVPISSTGVTGVTGITGGTGFAPTTTTSTTTTTVPIERLPQVVPPGALADIPPTAVLAVTAIVRDPGNVPLTGVTVAISLTTEGKGSPAVHTRSSSLTLGTIGATRSKFVNGPTFTVTSSVSRYLLRVTVTADGVPTVSRTFGLRIAS